MSLNKHCHSPVSFVCLTFQYATDFEIPISIGLFYQKSTISNRGTNGAKVFAKPRNPKSKNGDYFRVLGVDFFCWAPITWINSLYPTLFIRIQKPNQTSSGVACLLTGAPTGRNVIRADSGLNDPPAKYSASRNNIHDFTATFVRENTQNLRILFYYGFKAPFKAFCKGIP